MTDILKLRDEFCVEHERYGGKCSTCKLSITNNGTKLLCTSFCENYPEDAMEIIKGTESEDVISEAEFQALLGREAP